MTDHTNQLADSYYAGRDAYLAGQPETANPYPRHLGNELAIEWDRGYRIARKHARFAATIKARKERALEQRK